MKLKIHSIDGKAGKDINLSDAVFGVEPNQHEIYLAVKAYLAAQRQGNSKSKERAEIAGSTKKIKRQKGTGTARAGSIKSPIFKGGGTVFGPRKRDYDIKLNKKVKANAKRSALSLRAKEDGIMVVENFSFDAPKTSQYTDMLKNLSVADQKTVVVVGENDHNVYMSSRNVANSKVKLACDLNVYDMMNCNKLVMTEAAVQELENKLAN